ncbi:hypothetical protein [Ralstonia solanacearum]|uniref:hypothetical protein n=1 Tax=Ralstonia solanacearum TaxID=305 RepID=UPI001E54EBE9|nr:hypothetical protein [Ralstonia solanacearum]
MRMVHRHHAHRIGAAAGVHQPLRDRLRGDVAHVVDQHGAVRTGLGLRGFLQAARHRLIERLGFLQAEGQRVRALAGGDATPHQFGAVPAQRLGRGQHARPRWHRAPAGGC